MKESPLMWFLDTDFLERAKEEDWRTDLQGPKEAVLHNRSIIRRKC